MKPIEFEQQTAIAAKDQAEYMPLPMYRDDEQVISCWSLSWRERLQLLVSGRLWLHVLQGRLPYVVPTLITTDSPFEVKP